jgi:hypothetical protein
MEGAPSDLEAENSALRKALQEKDSALQEEREKNKQLEKELKKRRRTRAIDSDDEEILEDMMEDENENSDDDYDDDEEEDDGSGPCDEREEEGEELSPEDEEKLKKPLGLVQQIEDRGGPKFSTLFDVKAIFRAQTAQWKKHPKKDFDAWNKVKFCNVIESVAGGRTQTGKVRLLAELALYRAV